MIKLQIYPTYQEATFLRRQNRFVMELQIESGEIIQAHVPNTGRMEEFCLAGQPFFIAPASGKYSHKVIATRYQGAYVFLDTIKVNDIFGALLTRNLIPAFRDAADIRREVTFGASKFDFTFTLNQRPAIVEVKSCTLCHNGVAMFPDAPTLRGQKHLADLERLAREAGYDTHVVFLILHAGAQRFLPNLHTDPDYARLVLSSQAVQLHPYALTFSDPATAELATLRDVPLDWETLRANCQNKGSYLLLLENPSDITQSVGKLGNVAFSRGWYVYVGSAMNSLDTRLKRHQRAQKTRFWHIDYIASTVMPIRKIYPIRRAIRLEDALAHALESISDGSIPGFGASDSAARSHLFYFREPPDANRQFMEFLFTFRTI